MAIILPKSVKNCISVLENAGYEAFCVGGAVRDMIMGLTPFDFDVTTNCPPHKVQALFEKTVPTGIEHGTVTVVLDDMAIEVTTYRTEGGYSDSRHPDEVSFVGNIEDDLARRDFTVNAIAYNEKRGIFDPFGGMKDIENRTLRTVGEATRRFSEDALRIMRLYRFSSQLDFSIDAATSVASQELLPLLEKISVERIFGELKKLLCGRRPENACRFFELGGLEFLGLCKCRLDSISALPPERSIRFATLCILSQSDSDTLLKNLKADNYLKNQVAALIDLFCRRTPHNDISLKCMLRIYGEEILKKSFYLNAHFDKKSVDEDMKKLDRILASGEPFTIADLAIGGADLTAAGFEGREVGKTLEQLLDMVIENPSLNSREKLLEIITK